MSSVDKEQEAEVNQIVADEASRVAAVHARREYMAKLRGENPPYFVKSASVVAEQDSSGSSGDKNNNNNKRKKQQEKKKVKGSS